MSPGLGTASAGSQAVTVNGNIHQVAAGQIQSAPLNFGTAQVGQSVSQAPSIRNTATGAAGFVEDLNASFGVLIGTGAGLISGAGSLNGVLAGTNSTAGYGSDGGQRSTPLPPAPSRRDRRQLHQCRRCCRVLQGPWAHWAWVPSKLRRPGRHPSNGCQRHQPSLAAHQQFHRQSGVANGSALFRRRR